MEMKRKYASGVIVGNQSGLTDRQIRVIANSGRPDRINDVLVPKGCKLSNYQKNPIVLANHDPDYPIGNFAPEVTGEGVAGVVTFAPLGISAKADEFCGLYKAGVLNAVSVGFQEIESAPNKGGGMIYEQWELLEMSMVSVPCDPGAVVTARALQEGKMKVVIWSCSASRNLPLNLDKSWDGPAAEKRIFEKAGFGGDKPDMAWAAKAFLAHDPDHPELRSSYKFPIADVIDGRLTCLESGVKMAISCIMQDDDVGGDFKDKAQAIIDAYETRFKLGDQPVDDGKSGAPVAKEAFRPNIKGLHEVAQLAHVMEHLGKVQFAAELETACEQDSSKVPGMLADALAIVENAFRVMTIEEVSEMLSDTEVDIDPND